MHHASAQDPTQPPHTCSGGDIDDDRGYVGGDVDGCGGGYEVGDHGCGDEFDRCSLSSHLHLHGVSLNHLILDNVRFKLWWV